MYRFQGVFQAVVLAITFFLGSVAFAQSQQGVSAREFGLGQPQSVEDLPPGLLKNQLNALPPQARANGLRSLQAFSFPEADVDSLNADREGNIFYIDPPAPDQQEAASAGGAEAQAAPASTLDDAFLLHSKPGASNVVFVDFDGHVITGTAWNSTYSTLDALPYDLDGDPSTFSSEERTRIVDIWHRIAEDLAPFDIDVTTEEPASFNRYTGRILVTHTVDGAGRAMPSNSGGGVAYVGVWGLSNYHTTYSPALVYYNHLGGGSSTSVAEASSHELGHNLGLSHDGVSGGAAYYQGHGPGLVSWAPIMGVGYYKNVTQWSKGEYTNANNTQDDLDIIDGRLGYDFDDHGDSIGSASELNVSGTGSVVSSNPEFDPHNLLPENKGIIGTSDDVDAFSFVSGTGPVDLTVTPAWDAFYRGTSNRGANLDILAELRNVSGALVASSDPTTDTSANISTTVNAGTYYLLVTGVGNASSPYSDYASQGMYFINGTVPPASDDETPPTPDPMAFALAPAAISYDAISMTAVTATDDISSVQYNFRCIAGGSGCVNSGWQAGTSYTASGLEPSTQYTFTVEARDSSNNVTAPSGPASATTDAPPPPPAAPNSLAANGASETSINLSWNDVATTESAYLVQRSAAGAGSWSLIATLGANATGYTDTGLQASTPYDYRVAAENEWGVSTWATASGTTDDPPPFVDFTSNSDTPVAGSVSGSHTATHADDNSTQSITERESGGKKQNRYTYLEHRWNFNVSAGLTTTFFVQAWRSGSNSSESFDFEYSLNNGNSFAFLLNVSSTNSNNLQSVEIPGAPSGSIIVRVRDTHQVDGDRNASTVHVDHLFIQVGNPPTNPPDGDPGPMSATPVSASQIDLAWTDGSSNEAGFTVERSPNVSGNWSEIADLPADSESYSDTGLSASTRYYYRVRAYNANGSSAFVEADAMTMSPPPAPDAPTNLAAAGISTSQIDLSWDDGGPNETSYRVERSPAGLNSFDVVTSLAADTTGYSDTGLAAGTSYDYRVVAVNVSGEAESAVATGTTDSAPALSLSASGYKDRGKHHVVLEWTGGGNVDVYRGTSMVASDVPAPSYDDNIGNKGGATYQHRVCPVGETVGCSNTTTTVF